MQPKQLSTTSKEEQRKDQILNELAVDPWLFKTIKNIVKGSGLNDDITAELFIILGSKGPDYIIRAKENGYLQWMVVRILHTMHNSPRHPFFIQYRAKDENITPLIERKDSDSINQQEDEQVPYYQIQDTIELDLTDKEICEQKHQAIEMSLQEADEVMKAIWQKYSTQSPPSSKAVARYFGVPYSYIRLRITQFKETIKNQYHKQQIK